MECYYALLDLNENSFFGESAKSSYDQVEDFAFNLIEDYSRKKKFNDYMENTGLVIVEVDHAYFNKINKSKSDTKVSVF